MAEHTIIIRPTETGFSIRVEPPVNWTSYDATRPTLKAAKRYAAGLKIVRGWPVAYQGGEPA